MFIKFNTYKDLINLKQTCEKFNFSYFVLNKLDQGYSHERRKEIRATLRYIFCNTKVNIFICVKIEHTEVETFIILE